MGMVLEQKQRASILICRQQTARVTLGLEWASETLKPTPSSNNDTPVPNEATCPNSSKESINWGLSIQKHEPMQPFSFKTTPLDRTREYEKTLCIHINWAMRGKEKLETIDIIVRKWRRLFVGAFSQQIEVFPEYLKLDPNK